MRLKWKQTKSTMMPSPSGSLTIPTTLQHMIFLWHMCCALCQLLIQCRDAGTRLLEGQLTLQLFFEGRWLSNLNMTQKLFPNIFLLFYFFLDFQNEVTEIRGEKNVGRWFLALASGPGPPTWTHFLRPCQCGNIRFPEKDCFRPIKWL